MPQGENQSKNRINREENIFITIDDLIRLAEELVVGLNQLGKYKYPLDIRKGVRDLNTEAESVTIKASGRTYFLDIKTTRDGRPYLVVTESRTNGQEKRSSIYIFQENVQEFAAAVSKLAKNI